MEEIQVCRERNVMKQSWRTGARCLPIGLAMVIALAVTMGCNRTRLPVNQEEYVEIDNPFTEGNPAETSKIWVPKSSLESGLPRGRELVKKGYDKLAAGAEPAAEKAAQPATPRHRLLTAEVGNQKLTGIVRGRLAQSCIVRPVELKPTGKALSNEETKEFVATAARQPGGGPVLILDAPAGADSGAVIKADLYDGRGPVLLRSFTVRIPEPEKDESGEEAVIRAVSGLTGAVVETLGRTPWYARVIAVKGARIYVDAGVTTGLKQGQRLAVYRGGEVISGLGFAHGDKITTFSLTDYVGSDGAFGITADAAKVQPGDFVEPEQ